MRFALRRFPHLLVSTPLIPATSDLQVSLIQRAFAVLDGDASVCCVTPFVTAQRGSTILRENPGEQEQDSFFQALTFVETSGG